MKSHKHEPGTKRFKYTGNISHIKAYIEKNKPDHACMVEIYVRPLTREEREIYGPEGLKSTKGQVRTRAKPADGCSTMGYKVEKKPRTISRADLERWRSKIQGATAP